MPGLRLTIDQGARLWGLERDECEAVLDALAYRNFLSGNGDGKYARVSERPARRVPPPRKGDSAYRTLRKYASRSASWRTVIARLKSPIGDRPCV